MIRKVGIALNQESDNCEIDDCLRCFYGDEMVDKGTEDWTNAVERGGCGTSMMRHIHFFILLNYV